MGEWINNLWYIHTYYATVKKIGIISKIVKWGGKKKYKTACQTTCVKGCGIYVPYTSIYTETPWK